MSWYCQRPAEDELLTVAALADGSLAPAARVEAAERVAASPVLSAVLEQQVAVVTTIRSNTTPAPPRLRTRIEAEARKANERARLLRRRISACTLAAATTTAAVIVALMLSGGGADRPSVAAVGVLGVRGPLEPAPATSRERPALLLRESAGLPFPNLESKFAWRTVGARQAAVDGQPATTVLYEKDGRRLAYTIVAGEPLAAPREARRSVRGGVPFDAYANDGAQAVTWWRGGHTCVLSGEGVTAAELLKLASWTGRGTIPS